MATQIEQLAPPRLPARLPRVLEARFGGDLRATYLCAEFLSCEGYYRRFVTELLAVSDGSAGDSWNVRLFATLMLANQCRHLDPANEEEFKFLFRKFGILSRDGKQMDDSVLREGYTSTDFKVFIAQFLGNLNRLEKFGAFGLLTAPSTNSSVSRASPASFPWQGICSLPRKSWIACSID